ncbi:hypothetical protein ZIOFF_022586 [Zingiber officinale]|uniref:Sec1 family domain-containing protein MIP3 n=1 Tax=Zingiber officinale TaxID=94328 RepID=A0A8J5HD55_ZINOF|nr:hypothetical protein ZIOFF_022586 [Zingiber officinale]
MGVAEPKTYHKVGKYSAALHVDSPLGSDAFHEYETLLVQDYEELLKKSEKKRLQQERDSKKLTGSIYEKNLASEDDGCRKLPSCENDRAVYGDNSINFTGGVEFSAKLFVSVDHFPMIFCPLSPRVFILPSEGRLTEACLSTNYENSISPGLPSLSAGSSSDGDDVPPGATLTANFLYHLLEKMDLKMEIFSLGDTSKIVGKMMMDMSSLYDVGRRNKRSAGLLLIDRTMVTLLTPCCHGDSFLDRLLSPLPRRERILSSLPALNDCFASGWSSGAIESKSDDHTDKFTTDAVQHEVDLLGGSFLSNNSGTNYLETLLDRRSNEQDKRIGPSHNVLSFQDALLLSMIGYILAGKSFPTSASTGPFSWEEEHSLKEAVVDAVMENPSSAKLHFLHGLSNEFAAKLDKEKDDFSKSSELDDFDDQWGNWDDEDTDNQNAQAYDDMQLKLELRDRVDQLFKFFNKLSSLRQRNSTLREGLAAYSSTYDDMQLKLELRDRYGSDMETQKSLLYKLLTTLLAKYDVPGLVYHSSAAGRFSKSGFGRFGLGQAKPSFGDQSVLFIFVVGGMNSLEVREAMEAIAEYGRSGIELIVGGTTLLTPNDILMSFRMDLLILCYAYLCRSPSTKLLQQMCPQKVSDNPSLASLGVLNTQKKHASDMKFAISRD